MKKLISTLVLCALMVPVTALAQTGKGGPYQISGFIRGLGNDSIVIFISNRSTDGSRQKTDTLLTRAMEGRFHLQGSIDRPRFVWAQTGLGRRAKSFSFFLEQGKININGTVDSLDRLSITGTPSNNDLLQAHTYTAKIYDRITSLRSQLKTEEPSGERHRQLTASIASKYDSVDRYEIEFVRSHPHSFASSVFLYVKQDKLPVEELEQLYTALDDEIKKEDLVLMIPQKIRARKSVAVGNKAPEFFSFDTSGKIVRLSDFRGKYVLLEFWASWCVPCRQQSPHLVSLYEKYSGKGFTILQYSVDEKNAEQKWLQAIRADGLKWTQISDLAGLNNEAARLYGVQPIPDNFLIDPDGRIIGRRLEGKELEEKLKTVLQ